MHQKIHVLITFLFFLLNVMAQQPLVMQLTEKEGLPDKEFYNVLEDDKGFIWLAADKGLYRYNGKEFQLFSHPDQVGLSVFSLKKDEDDTIWYTNLANQVFYVKDGEVTLFLNLKEYFSGSLPRIFFHKNRLILASIRTLLIIDKNTKKIIYKKQGNDNVFNSDAFIHNDAICFFDDEGNLITIDKNLKFHQKATKLNYKTNSRISVFTDEISGMYVFMKRYLTLPHEYILFEIDNNFEIKIHTKYSGQKRFVHKIKSIQNELFEASNEGVQIYTVAQETLQLKDSLLKNVSISDMLKDSNGNLWFTTLFEGIYVVPNLQLNTNVEIPNGNTIRRLYKGKDNELLLVGKQKEFYLFHHDINTTTTFASNNVADIKYMFYNTFKSLYYLQTTKALQAFTIQDTTINFLEDYQPGILKDHAIINKDSTLLATGESIILTNMRNKPSKNNVEILYNESLRSYSCYYNNITKHSYFGTVKGLYAFDEHFTKSEILHNNNSIFIKDIVASNDGSVWCLSFKNGIYQIQNNKIVKNITVEDGLLSNLNDFIRCDTKNNLLWIAGEKGLQQFNIRTATFQNLTKKQGIPSYEFTGLEMVDDKVYVSTLNRLFSFNSKTIFNEQNSATPIPYFVAITINDEVQKTQANYTLPHDNEKIEIAFNTNGFLSIETVKYQYRLIANSEENVAWQDETSRSNKVVYNKLSKGNYVFQLRAKNGFQQSEIISLAFVVESVFYQEWWFYVLGTALISFLIWSYYHKQNERLKEKQQLLLDKQSKELENVFLKLESLRSQMNPHFIFNALNSIQDYIIRNEQKLARTYLVKFSRLIRMYLEHSQKDVIPIAEEIAALELYLQLEKDRFEDSFEYKINLSDSVEKEALIPTFLMQPYAENAIKHGLLHKKENRKLHIDFTYDNINQQIICSIEDNGIGRVASEKINNRKPLKPQSFSSAANEKRIELLNKTRKKAIKLHIEDKMDANDKPSGTKVTVYIPSLET